jgi:hypothetical protein
VPSLMCRPMEAWATATALLVQSPQKRTVLFGWRSADSTQAALLAGVQRERVFWGGMPKRLANV